MLEAMGINSPQQLEQQHDAAQCIETMLSIIPSLNFLVHEIQDKIECTGCKNLTMHENPWPVAPIDISTSKRNRHGTFKFSAADAIKKYFDSTEYGIQRDCENCHASTCSKQVSLLGSPHFIVAQFKLFEATTDRILRNQVVTATKINAISEAFSFVDINTSEGIKRYEVIASIEHIGNTLQRGHYVSYVLINDTWYLCNDTKVKPLAKGLVPLHSIHMYYF